MEQLHSILEKTLLELKRVGNAMVDVTDFLYGSPSETTALDNCKFAVDMLEEQVVKVKDMMNSSLDYIEEKWADIMRSEPWEHEVLSFCEDCKRFYDKVVAFEESVCVNDDLGATILNDCWIARKYYILMTHWITRAEFIMNFADANFQDRQSNLGPFFGLAKMFRPFFTGVTDEELRDFVLNGIPIASRPIWRGERCEGTLMGQELGLECADMNHSFSFLNEKRMPRPLKYSSDPVSNDRRYYRISRPLDHLKKALSLTSISQKTATAA